MGLLSKLFGGRKEEGNRLNELQSGIGNWKTVESEEFKFILGYPAEWMLEQTEQGIELYPPNKSVAYDSGLQRYVASPGINIHIINSPGKGANIVSDLFTYRESNGYEGYEFGKYYFNEINKTNPAVIYEFGYGKSPNRFRAMSLLVEKNGKLYNVTGSCSASEYERYRGVLERVILTFKIG